jgi:hypothetical protein
MRWDAGALSRYRNKSPIFRYLSKNPPRSYNWPVKWREELGIFLATPGISWRWIQINFNMTEHRLHILWRDTEHIRHLGQENILTATKDDASIYMENRPHGSPIPFWVEPFIIDEIKDGCEWRPVCRKWNISQTTLSDFLKGRRNSGFLYSSNQQRRWNFMGR